MFLAIALVPLAMFSTSRGAPAKGKNFLALKTNYQAGIYLSLFFHKPIGLGFLTFLIYSVKIYNLRGQSVKGDFGSQTHCLRSKVFDFSGERKTRSHRRISLEA